MRFPTSFLEEIKHRLPMSEVVRRRVKLQKAGREWKGLSPFNQERTPSFTVNDQKGFFHCFSSGQHGNIFDFLMLTEGLSFPEAVERLANDAGLALPRVSAESEEREKQRAGLHEILEWAALFFEKALQSPAGANARTYLAQRGLSPDLQTRFRLGFSPPEKYALRDHLAGKGATREAMIEAGLLVHGPEIAVPYDRFRERIMFPIADRSGRVIAFGGRALSKDVAAKYLNSPETPLFHKGAGLYNLHQARKPAHEAGTVIAVEGYVDVIAMTAAGFPHVVAPLGTALTRDQCALLWRMAEEPILCFDGDRAGRKAAYRAADVALPLLGPSHSLRFALLPEGQDPDDLARSGGRMAIEGVLEKALPLVDLVWMRETEAGGFTTPERRAALEQRLEDLARGIKDPTLQRYYRGEFANRLAALFGPLAAPASDRRDPSRPFGARSSFPRSPFQGRGARNDNRSSRFQSPDFKAPLQISSSLARSRLLQTARSDAANDLPPSREALILLLLLRHPGLIDRHVEALAALDFVNTEASALRSLLLEAAWHDGADDLPPSHEALLDRLTAEGKGALLQKLESVIPVASHWYLQPDAADIDAEALLEQAITLHQRAGALHRELQLAKAALAEDTNETNFDRLKDIQAQLQALGGTEAAVEGFGFSSGRSTGTV
ncbi:DNA primase [Beijerinckia indica]|uniref:DNA primase n=1 Tax=Beijerinckia indica subsp. indica (strain ATCC 9039 / DSM 1715 / NCIMB 8712) TaxID=395963 RepID=B2IDS5_BEII9|nr:DNA primase [Beijerinckia indica]ACB96857.1 DNA primase [Beijerinckia indica subsp. indica ATCC 9039]